MSGVDERAVEAAAQAIADALFRESFGVDRDHADEQTREAFLETGFVLARAAAPFIFDAGKEEARKDLEARIEELAEAHELTELAITPLSTECRRPESRFFAKQLRSLPTDKEEGND